MFNFKLMELSKTVFNDNKDSTQLNDYENLPLLETNNIADNIINNDKNKNRFMVFDKLTNNESQKRKSNRYNDKKKVKIEKDEVVITKEIINKNPPKGKTL